MGTNYYWFKEKINIEDVSPEAGLHIGKNSYGWVFTFRAYPNKALTTYYQWREFTKNGYIYDEYDRIHSYKEFWEMVMDSKEEIRSKEGEIVYRPLTLQDMDENDKISCINDYMNNGFIFTECDFS